jgi:hypothetical protein
MPKYKVDAKRTHWYTVEVEAETEQEALEEVRDWLADDFEDFETNAQWDFDVWKDE